MIHFACIPSMSDRVTGNLLSAVARKTFAHSVVILCKVFYIDELVTEQKQFEISMAHNTNTSFCFCMHARVSLLPAC